MGTKMANAPVYFAIVQARFNPILALDSYAPSIQDELRKSGFPDVRKGVLSTFNLLQNPAIEGTQSQVPVSQVSQYAFLNIDKTAGFLLDQAALSFQTCEYDVFELFSNTFLVGLNAVHKAVTLNYTDRIGLRYLDVVFPKVEEKLPVYLNECVLGLYEKSGGSIVHSFSETVFKVEAVSVTSRAIVQDGPLGFPPDLQSHNLVVPDRFQALRGIHAVLDTDGSVDHREPFNVEAVRNHLYAIHYEITKAFKATVTDYALKEWA